MTQQRQYTMSQVSELTSPSGEINSILSPETIKNRKFPHIPACEDDCQLKRPSTENEVSFNDLLTKATFSDNDDEINFDVSSHKNPLIQELKLQGKGQGKETRIKVRTLTSMWSSRNSNNDESGSLLKSLDLENNGLTICDIDEENSKVCTFWVLGEAAGSGRQR